MKNIITKLVAISSLLVVTSGCAADMINLDPKFQEIDASIAQNEARITALEDDYVLFKTSVNEAIAEFNQSILDFMPPGFVLCVISSDTAFNWELQYGTDSVKVNQIIGVSTSTIIP